MAVIYLEKSPAKFLNHRSYASITESSTTASSTTLVRLEGVTEGIHIVERNYISLFYIESLQFTDTTVAQIKKIPVV